MIPVEVEHVIHEFLQIGEVVFVLQLVSRSWRSRVGDALRRRFQWDVRICLRGGKLEGSDVTTPPHVWLETVARVRVRIRSLYVDAQGTPVGDIIRVASRAGFANAVELLLLEFAGDVNAASSFEQTPLHSAALYGHCDVVKLLLAVSSIDVNATNLYGQTPLHLAALCGHCDVVEALLAVPNIDVNTADDWYENTPLHFATRFGHHDVVEALLAVPSINANAVSRDVGSPWVYNVHAPRIGDGDFEEMLLEEQFVNASVVLERTPLHSAAFYGHCDVVKLLLAVPNIDVNVADVRGDVPLHSAARNGHRDVVEALLAVPDIDVNCFSLRRVVKVLRGAPRGARINVWRCCIALYWRGWRRSRSTTRGAGP